jgi:ABC-type multidrug transport system, permease component
VLRGLMVGAIVLGIAMCFTTVRIPHPLVTLSTVLLGATIFSLAGFVNAVYARKFDDIAIVPTFILTPLTYLGGVFYSVTLLPPGRGGHPRQPDLLHGQRLPLRPAGHLGRAAVGGLRADAGLRAVLSAVSLWLLRRGVGLRS